MRWALTTMPDCWAWRKIWVRRTRGMVPAASRSRRTSPAPTEGSWSTSPTSSRCAPAGMALTSLLAKITSIIEASSTTTRSASRGCVAVVFGVAAGLQLQQPVHGGSVVAGQLGQPFGGPAGGRDQHHGGLLGRGELDDGTDGEALPAAGAAGQHGHLLREGELGRLLLPGGQVLPGPGVQPSPVPCPSPRPANAGSRSCREFSRASSPAASDCSARWKATR